MKQYDYLIVGAGLFGAVFANEAKKAGSRCLVIEQRNHAGGNIYCDRVEGINVHMYGAHIFHTSNKEVWEYVNNLVPFNRFTNCPILFYKGHLYNLPFNMNTFYGLWGVKTPAEAQAKIAEQRAEYAHIKKPANLEEQALTLCGKDIYERFIKGYTEKQWGLSATELPPFIIKRIPFRFTFDNNYFNDDFQGVPIGGYNKLIDAMLADVEVLLDTDYFANREKWDNIADKVLFTGCIDQYFNYRFGRLDYRSLRFDTRVLAEENFQGSAVINYSEREVPYTRVIEHKHFENTSSPLTVVTYEYPDDYEDGKVPYYPINNERNSAIYAQYKELADNCNNVFFGGRLAQYTYADMDDTVEAALAMWHSVN